MKIISFKINRNKSTVCRKILWSPYWDPSLKSTIVIYTCILTRDTRVNSSVEYCFTKSLHLQVRVYPCKWLMYKLQEYFLHQIDWIYHEKRRLREHSMHLSSTFHILCLNTLSSFLSLSSKRDNKILVKQSHLYQWKCTKVVVK